MDLNPNLFDIEDYYREVWKVDFDDMSDIPVLYYLTSKGYEVWLTSEGNHLYVAHLDNIEPKFNDKDFTIYSLKFPKFPFAEMVGKCTVSYEGKRDLSNPKIDGYKLDKETIKNYAEEYIGVTHG